jgi:hypothetical protein
MNPAEVEGWRSNSRTLSSLAVTMPVTRTMTTHDGPVRLDGARVSPELFSMRNVQPIVGRWLHPSEGQADARVAVISAAIWQRYYRGSDVIDRDIVLDGQVFTVADEGLAPRPPFGRIGTVDTVNEFDDTNGR